MSIRLAPFRFRLPDLIGSPPLYLPSLPLCLYLFAHLYFTVSHHPSAPSRPRVCASLRCLSCDFAVMQFEGGAWDETVDYMFFRNNVPNTRLLRAKINRDGGESVAVRRGPAIDCDELMPRCDELMRWDALYP